MRRWILVATCLSALFGLILWRVQKKNQEVEAQAQMRQARMKAPAMVSVLEAKRRDVVQNVEAIGTVESPYNVRIAPRISGQIEYLEAREGDRVRQGQVLVRLDESDLNGVIRQRQAEFAAAESRLAQAQLVQNPTNVAANANIRQQEAAVASAEAELKQAQQNYDQLIAGSVANLADKQSQINSAQAEVAHANALIKSAQANLANARARYERLKALVEKGFVPQQNVDDARTFMEVQQANLEVAQEQRNTAQGRLESAQAQKRAAEAQSKIGKNKGDTDIAAADAKLKQAKAALTYARANIAQQPAYQQNLAALRSAVAAAEAALRSAESRREDAVLKAPLDGLISERLTDPGAMATPGQTILTLVTQGRLWIATPIPEEVSRQIRMGQTAQVTLDALGGRTFTGRVVRINPAADPMSRQFTVRIALENPGNQIKPGMFGRVRLELARNEQQIVVPTEAVQRDGKGNSVVFVVKDDQTAHSRIVQVGASDSAGVAILEGLQPGERIVTLSAAPLKDGQAIRIGAQPSSSAAKK